MIVNKSHVPNKTKEEFENLNEEQRRREMKVKADKDLLLNFFGIHHLHLENNYNNRATKGIKFTINENFERGKELLYAKVDKDKVYLIDINNHDLFDNDILRIIKNNWNHLLEPYESNLSYISDYSDAESKELLQNGINAPYKIDDKIYVFLGISAIGTSHTDFMDSKNFFNEIQKYYNEIVNLKKEITLNKIKQLNKSIVKEKNLQIHIIIKDGLLFFIDKLSKSTVKLEDKEIYISNQYCEIGYHMYDFNS